MSNEPKPLLSERLRRLYIHAKPMRAAIADEFELAFGQAIDDARTIESELYDRSKLMAVLQVCADALRTCDVFDPDYDQISDAISQLKAIGVEPSNTKEG